MAVAPPISGTAVHIQEPTDQQLVRAFNDGDSRAFTTIVHRHQQQLERIAWRYANNAEDVQDIMQEALFKAARYLRGWRGEASLGTWLHRLVMNAGVDHIKRRQRSLHISLDDDSRVNLDAHPALAHDPLAHLDHVLVLRQVLTNLPQAQRRALMLIDIAGMTVERAAREMGVQPGTVKSRRARARQALAHEMRP